MIDLLTSNCVVRIQTDSNTIDDNVEFEHSQYTCTLMSHLSTLFLCQTKSLLIVITIISIYIKKQQTFFKI